MNLSRLSAALAATLALWAIAPVAPQAQVRLPALGEASGDELSIGAERKLGEQVMREIWRDPDYVDDPPLQDYLQTIWQPLWESARERGNITPELETAFAWQPFLVRDRTINAFALPGGYVGVHLGLMAMTTTRDELAAVLAHEMSHVTQRHIARSIASAERQSMLGLAALILGALAASRSGSADATQAVIVGSQAAMAQGQLNFSRDMEREADRVGYGVLHGAGFSPSGVATMFERLDLASRLNDSNSYPYLRSHPLTTERIGEARQRASLGKPVPQSAPLWHGEMQARARVLMDPREPSLRRLQAAEAVSANATPIERVSALYGSALASIKLRDWARGDATIEKALAVVRASPTGDNHAERELQSLQAQSYIARGEAPKALALLKQVGDDGSRANLLLRAQAATAAAVARRSPENDAQARASMEALQTWVSVHRHDAGAWSELAPAAELLGLKLRAIRADAESHAAIGDLGGAIDRLRAGQRISKQAAPAEFIDASIIDARLRELEGQRRALNAEMRAERRGGSRDEPPE